MATLIIERYGGVVTVTMNRPERKNAANRAMLSELRTCLEAVERSPEDRVLVLTGAGGTFCSGADLSDPGGSAEEGAQPGLTQMRRLGDVALSLHRLSKPSIARVDGFAVGAGLSLALGCDLVLASEGAKFSAIFAQRGLSLDFGASWLLPRLVGMARAKELALLGDLIGADEALAMGLVNRVLPLDELDTTVAEWAGRLAVGPTLALSMTKTLLHQSGALSMDEALEAEARAQAVNFFSDDLAEALRAFAEKRTPRFTGH
jgi:2-(1,2-epoxy-1,2-dihydrophenyl)acetyl-CoA isomerase